MAKKQVRVIITFACDQCKRRNYSNTKNKREHPDRLAFRRYCSFCRTHTTHKETR